MNSKNRDYFYSQLKVSVQGHGRALLQPLQCDDDGLTVVAAGPYGNLVFREILCEDYTLLHNTYTCREDMTVSYSVPGPFLGFHFAVRNDINYTSPGLPGGVIFRNQYNMFYLPEMESSRTFRGEQEYESFIIHFTPAYLKRWEEPFPLLSAFLDSLGSTPAQINRANMSATPEMMAIIQHILQCNYTGKIRRMFLQAKVLELLMLALQNITPEGSFVRPLRRHSDIERIEEARQYLVANLEEPCTLDELAQKVGINVFKLKVGFKQVYGTTVFALLTEERMQRAIHLLRDTDKLVVEVSEAVGYKNLPNFTSAFKRRFGFTPSAVKQGQ
jgi:AraC family transcriptional regulator, transcriptional activator of the genes for pyochelin and ferripyochelin receptors